jgi:hypothetical protein
MFFFLENLHNGRIKGSGHDGSVVQVRELETDVRRNLEYTGIVCL